MARGVEGTALSDTPKLDIECSATQDPTDRRHIHLDPDVTIVEDRR
jgi:hypothetical protein